MSQQIVRGNVQALSTSIEPSSFFVTDGVEVDDTEMSIHGKRAVLERLVMGGDLLATMSVNDRAPKLAIVVEVSEVFMHCAKAFRRSHLWSPDHFQDRTTMPSLLKIILDETTGAPSDGNEMRRIDEDLEDEYKRTLTNCWRGRCGHQQSA
jgi:hypothetical protein